MASQVDELAGDEGQASSSTIHDSEVVIEAVCREHLSVLMAAEFPSFSFLRCGLKEAALGKD